MSDENAHWQNHAACSRPGLDPNLFFPERGQTGQAAKRICVSCPVRLDCLHYAIDNGITHGIWGGKNERERRPIYKGVVSFDSPVSFAKERTAGQRVTPELAARIYELRADGWTVQDIEAFLGVSRTTVERWGTSRDGAA